MTRINTFYEEWSWFKFKNLGLALDMALKFYGSVKKRLKLKVQRFWRQIPTFIEVTGKNWQRRSFCAPLSLPIFNRINLCLLNRNNRFKQSFYYIYYVKIVQIRSYFWSVFSAFGLNRERYGRYLDTFHAVVDFINMINLNKLLSYETKKRIHKRFLLMFNCKLSRSYRHISDAFKHLRWSF